jgi:hypothetical protein
MHLIEVCPPPARMDEVNGKAFYDFRPVNRLDTSEWRLKAVVVQTTTWNLLRRLDFNNV